MSERARGEHPEAAAETIGALGEDTVLAALREVIDAHNRAGSTSGSAGLVSMPVGPGDDAAVLRLGDPRLVVTTDTMSEGQDFRHRWWDDPAEAAHSVGVKAAAQNLSDLSGMGARPVALLVSLTLPAHAALGWTTRLMEGIAEAASAPGADGCLIAGGDLGSGDVVSVTITALGVPVAGHSLLRDGARPGDQLAVCGALGHAAAGLALLEDDLQVPLAGPASVLRPCLDAQRRPAPDLTAGPRAVAAGASAGMDVSDGLLRDADRLARASRVTLVLDDAAIDREVSALRGALGVTPPGPDIDPDTDPDGDLDALQRLRSLVLRGGEDYALLATFPAQVELPEGFRRLGEVRRHDGAPGVVAGGTVGEGSADADSVPEGRTSQGWDSLRGAS